MIDLHCHILPGLDDGAATLDEAVEMAKIAERDGIETIVATPHFFRGDVSLGDLASIEEKRRALNEVLQKNEIRVEVKSGAEVHISHNLLDAVRNSRATLVLNGSSYMFVEFPAEHIFPGIKNLFFDLMSEGVHPIIAHPERNSVFKQNPGLLYDLVEAGAFAQANSGSFTGLYGRKSAEAVDRFLEWNLIHFIASDGHNPRHFPPMLSLAVERVESVVGKERALALVNDNPRAVLEDKELPKLLTPTDPRKLKKSLFIKLPRFLRRNR